MMIIRTLLKIYMLALIVDAILSYFPNLSQRPWRRKLREICDYTCAPVRRKLPPGLPLDFSPLIVILLINLLMFLW